MSNQENKEITFCFKYDTDKLSCDRISSGGSYHRALIVESNHELSSKIDKAKNIGKFAIGALMLILSIIAHVFSYALIDECQILIASEHSSIRFFIELVVMSSIIRYKQLELYSFTEYYKTISASSFLGSTPIILMYYSIGYISPLDTLSISHLSIIVATIMAYRFFHEQFDVVFILVSSLSATAVFLMFRPSFLEKTLRFTNMDMKISIEYKLGLCMVLIAILFLGTQIVFNKKLRFNEIHYSIDLFYPCLFGLFSSILVTVIYFNLNIHRRAYLDRNSDPRLLKELVYSIVSGVLASLSIVFLNTSVGKLGRGITDMFRTADIIFIYIVQEFILGIKSDILGIIGSVMILVSVFIFYLAKFIESKFESNNSFIYYLFFKF